MQPQSERSSSDLVPVANKLHPPTKIVHLPIDLIAVNEAHREVDETVVADLAKSMTAIGLQTAITVTAAVDGCSYQLVAGLHRLKAALLLGWTDIDAVVHDGDETSARLWQLSENLHRSELSALDRAVHVAKWIELSTIEGQVVPKFGAGRPEGAVTKAARTLPIPGKSQEAREKVARRSLQIDRITEEAKGALKEAGLDDIQSALLEVARQSGREAQLKKVAELGGQSVSDDRTDGPELPTDLPANQPLPAEASGMARSSLAGLIAQEQTFDLAVLTPTPEQIALAGKDYTDPEALEKWLPLHKVMRDKAAIVAVVRLSDAPVIASLMKAVCGFKAAKSPRVVLIHRPDAPEVSKAKVIIAAERGRARFTAPSADDWFTSNLDPLAMARRLYPTSTSLLRVFAAENVEGWTSLIGSNSWLQEPSVK